MATKSAAARSLARPETRFRTGPWGSTPANLKLAQ